MTSSGTSYFTNSRNSAVETGKPYTFPIIYKEICDYGNISAYLLLVTHLEVVKAFGSFA
jgi:hypothetical protein